MRFIPGQLPMGDWSSLVSALCSYVLIVFSTQYWMKDRKRFDLYFVIVGHNLLLCALSIVMLFAVVYEVYQKWMQNGQSLELLFCDSEGKLSEGRQVAWFYIFYLSKFYELLDTLIIVLKKNKIIFLHIYHHIITIVLVFVMMNQAVAVQWLAITANCMVHIPMYFYYAMSTLGYDIWWKKYITLFQITQFIVDVTSNLLGFTFHFGFLGKGKQCSGPLWAWCFGQGVLLSFLFLFIHFWRRNYRMKPSNSQPKNVEAKSQ